MFLKSKIYLTVLTVYEILAVILLHCRRTCDAMFGMSFCDDHVFKYFIFCFAIPAIVGLIVMWIMEIIYGGRRRRSFIYRAKNAVRDVASSVREHIGEHVSAADMEKLMAAALLVGIKRYVSKHPKHRGDFEDVLGKEFVASANEEYAAYDIDEYDYDADDDDDEEYAAADKNSGRRRRGNATGAATTTRRAATATKTTRKSDNNRRKK